MTNPTADELFAKMVAAIHAGYHDADVILGAPVKPLRPLVKRCHACKGRGCYGVHLSRCGYCYGSGSGLRKDRMAYENRLYYRPVEAQRVLYRAWVAALSLVDGVTLTTEQAAKVTEYRARLESIKWQGVLARVYYERRVAGLRNSKSMAEYAHENMASGRKPWDVTHG